jgi:hypothetical protein
MNDAELLRELSFRSGLPETAVVLVVQELRELIRDGIIDPTALPDFAATLHPAVTDQPDPRDPSLVEALIAKAKRHPLGMEFLLSGLLASVAIALGAHAFTVEAARAKLRKEQEKIEEEITVA